MSTLDATELRQRIRLHRRNVTQSELQMFLGYWLEAGIVEEPRPGRFRLTDYGRTLTRWLDTDDTLEEAA